MNLSVYKLAIISCLVFAGCGGGGGDGTTSNDFSPLEDKGSIADTVIPDQNTSVVIPDQQTGADQVTTTLTQQEKELQALQVLAGKTMVINYRYGSDHKHTLNFMDAPEKSDKENFKAFIGGEMDNGYTFVCTTTDKLKEIANDIGANTYDDYSYTCVWYDVLKNQNGILFNVSDDGVVGGFEYAFSSDNIFVEFLDGFDATLTDSYIY